MLMENAKLFLRFTLGSAQVVSRGGKGYYAWLGALLVVIAIGVTAYGNQVANGLITSNMRDQVSWGFYIGNFAYFVGVASAAVVLVIPAYVYNWGPLRDVVLIAELLSIVAIPPTSSWGRNSSPRRIGPAMSCGKKEMRSA